jgi:hypothetical protein
MHLFETDRKEGVDAAWNYIRKNAEVKFVNLQHSWLAALFFGFLLGMVFGHTIK